MKQNFDKKIHERFKSYFGIKESPSEIEKGFYKKTEKYIKYIKWIPGIRMIGIGNSISMNSANAESDIDLFIVTSPNSMWLNRIIITFIFQILGVRKNDKYHAGRFCLSFFATTTGLDFSDWKIENDIYLYFWIVYFKPILNYDNTYELFIEKNSSWADLSEYKDVIEDNKKYIKITSPQSSPIRRGSIRNLLKNFPFIPSPIRITETGVLARLSSKLERSRGLGGGCFERKEGSWSEWVKGGLNILLKKIFLPKTLKHFEKIGKPYGVIINDNLLKFHNGDIRKKIKEELVK